MNALADVEQSSVASEAAVNSILIRLTLAIFCAFLTIGIPLPVIPLYVRHELGFSNVVVGFAVGIQSLATVLTRRYAGASADVKGPKLAVVKGFGMCSLAGATYLAAALAPFSPVGKLATLFSGRLLLGVGESLLVTGGLAWGIGLAGPSRAGQVMAWTGMAIYGALAIGSPCGLALEQYGGFVAVSLVVALLPGLAILMIVGVPPTQPRAALRTPFSEVVRKILRPGVALALQGVGFAAIGTFVSLYFTSRHWGHAGLALSTFGGCFVLVRAVCGGLPDRLGGFRVAWLSLVVEACGQLLLWKAQSAAMALGGAAITGLGCSLVFPALGVESVRRVTSESRGTALGAFAAFQDISYGVTGPIAGLIATGFGYPAIFLFGAGTALLGMIIVTPRSRKSEFDRAAILKADRRLSRSNG
jgi:MFS family permease